MRSWSLWGQKRPHSAVNARFLLCYNKVKKVKKVKSKKKTEEIEELQLKVHNQ